MLFLTKKMVLAAIGAAFLLAVPAGEAADAYADPGPSQPCPSCASGVDPSDHGIPPGGSAAGGGQRTEGGGGKMGGKAAPAKPAKPVNP